MSVYNSSLLEQEHEASRLSAENREDDFRDVFDAALDPALQMCAAMAEMRQSERDRAIFWVNCDEAILGALEGFEFAGERRGRVQADEGKFVESLTDEHVRPHLLSLCPSTPGLITPHPQHADLLKTSGLDSVLAALHSQEDVRDFSPPSLSQCVARRTESVILSQQIPLSQRPSASAADIFAASSTFSTFLSSLDPVSSPRLSLLPPHLAALVHSQALQRVSKGYGELYDAVVDEKNGYEGRETLLRRRKDEVGMLLEVE